MNKNSSFTRFAPISSDILFGASVVLPHNMCPPTKIVQILNVLIVRGGGTWFLHKNFQDYDY